MAFFSGLRQKASDAVAAAADAAADAAARGGILVGRGSSGRATPIVTPTDLRSSNRSDAHRPSWISGPGSRGGTQRQSHAESRSFRGSCFRCNFRGSYFRDDFGGRGQRRQRRTWRRRRRSQAPLNETCGGPSGPPCTCMTRCPYSSSAEPSRRRQHWLLLGQLRREARDRRWLSVSHGPTGQEKSLLSCRPW